MAGDASVLFLGAATVAAMVAGFAGVVVIFALGSGSERFRYMRIRGGLRLRSNWTSVVAVSFLAAGLSVAAAFMRLTDIDGWIWAFEASALFLIHASCRLVWLLRQIASVVVSDDLDQHEENVRAPLDAVIRRQPRRTA
jgi:hypothetical protein